MEEVNQNTSSNDKSPSPSESGEESNRSTEEAPANDHKDNDKEPTETVAAVSDNEKSNPSSGDDKYALL